MIEIDTLARELNVGKDRLRKWERRYGFPQPLRTAEGVRLYPQEQVDRLRLICRLLDGGFRAGDLLPLDEQQLQQLSAAPPSQLNQTGAENRYHELRQRLNALTPPPQPEALINWLEQRVHPLIQDIGTAWSQGQLAIWQEHLLTEQLERRLAALLLQLPEPAGQPRALLCTLSGESHRLGILIAELALRSCGLQTCFLGSEVTPDQVLAALEGMQIELLALSFSSRQKRSGLLKSLQPLLAASPQLTIWLGGDGASQLRRLPAGVLAVRQLGDLPAHVQRWQRSQGR